jgi:prophage DNA circulation protein
MAAFDSLQVARFGDIDFPWSRLRVSCSLRDHVHIYPHAPGGQPEKLGRNLYEFHFTCPFHNTLLRWQTRNNGDNLWPQTLANLRYLFESGNSYELLVPTIGRINAYCTKWDEDADVKHRSGVSTEFSFREDASELFLTNELIQVRAAATISARQNFQQSVQVTGITDSTGTFDKLVAAVNELEAMKGAADISAQAISYKAQSVVALCQRAASLPVLDLPVNYTVLDSIRDMQSASQSLARDATKNSVPVVDYLVPGPFPMPVSLVSKRLYGDASHSLDIMRLNVLLDPLAIPPGTALKVFAPMQQAA